MLSQQVFMQGLGLGASLIMPIGAQNAHVIRTGIRGRHVLLTVATCIAVDAALIALGVSGFGALAQSAPALLAACRYGGAAFLLWYGLRRLAGAWRGGRDSAGAPQPADAPRQGDAGKALAAGHRASFAAGAMTASLLWFSGLGLLARRCAGLLGRPAVWRGIEALTGAVMLLMAVLLLSD